MKLYSIDAVLSLILTGVAYLFGGLDTMLITLLVLIVLDYITGLLVAGSEKVISSEVGFKGICKKVYILLLVGVATLIDRYVNLDGVARNLVTGFYIANEAISILENGGKLGVPIPQKLCDIIYDLKGTGADELESVIADQDENDLRG